MTKILNSTIREKNQKLKMKNQNDKSKKDHRL
jgi:hypothetical protein